MLKFLSLRFFWAIIIVFLLVLSFATRLVIPIKLNLFGDSVISAGLNVLITEDLFSKAGGYSQVELINEYIERGDVVARKFIELVDVEGERKLEEIYDMMTPESALCNRGYEKDWIYMNRDRDLMIKTKIIDLRLDKKHSIVKMSDENKLIEIILPYEEKIQAFFNDGEIWEAIKIVRIKMVERRRMLLVTEFFAEQREEAVFAGRWK